MATQEADDISRRYLKRLEKELGDLPAVYRNEVLDEIREHIADSRVAVQSDADMPAVLNRLGDPKSIADDARERFELKSYRAGTIEIAAIILLLFSFSIVGYIVGLVLVWRSPAWRRLDKLIGTLTPVVAVPAVWIAGAHLFLLVALIVAPVYLAVRMRNRSRAVLLFSLVPLGLVVVASVGLAVITGGGISGGGISGGNSYMVVNGQHVCWVGTSTANEKEVPCNSVTPPYGGWNDLEKNSFTTGYDYAIVAKGQHRCTVDTPKGIFQRTSCSSIPAPPGGWQAVAASQQSTNCVGDEPHCLFVATASPVVPPTTYPTP
ncbi:MAG TPA: hypothetical protein VMW47_02080 [Verrucomicrobiae bacterium]|nr:hypothetical protein [Verrucomicrobiae bacterium]